MGRDMLYNSHSKLSPKVQRRKVRDEVEILSRGNHTLENEGDVNLFIGVSVMGLHVAPMCHQFP